MVSILGKVRWRPPTNYSLKCTRCGMFAPSKHNIATNFLCWSCMAAKTNQIMQETTSKFMTRAGRAEGSTVSNKV